MVKEREQFRIVVREVVDDKIVYGAEPGKADFQKILKVLRQTPAGEGAILLDFRNMDLVDSSWAREVIGALTERFRNARPVALVNVPNAVIADNVDAGLLRLEICVLAGFRQGDPRVLGKRPTDQAIEVLEIVNRQKETTARAVCSALQGLSITACNNRLRDLLEAGLIDRAEAAARSGGREFIYRSLL